MIYLIGGNGFVGSAFARLFEAQGLEYQIITRDNAVEFKGTACDLLINANGNSKKFMATRDPLWEFDASVVSVARSLDWFEAERYVLLSTGDVYPQTHDPKFSDEEQVLDVAKMSRYGLHKFLAEQLVRGVHKNHLVFRMGGFVGPNLQKNAIFDMLTGGPLWLSLDSKLQFIHTDDAAKIVYTLASNPSICNQTINLGARGMASLREAYDHAGSSSEVKEDAQNVTYELSLEKLERLYGLSLPDSAETIRAFVLDNKGKLKQGS